MIKQNVISLNLTSEQENQLFLSFSEFQTKTVPTYAKWQLKLEHCVITCYQSGKTVFQGSDAEVYAGHLLLTSNANNSSTSHLHFPHAGSDEVGTGDYFGPVCVCACIVHTDEYQFLKQLSVQDSKALTDTEILKIAPFIMEKLTYSLLIVKNKKYNEVHQTSNMNAIKAKLHNQAYINLSKKENLPRLIVVDQFAEKKLYYNYLKHVPTIIHNLHFETKAENKYIAVAASSIIARYAFLKNMELLEKKYKMKLCKGAGAKVNECAKKFVEKYGLSELGNVAKLHFKNTEQIK